MTELNSPRACGTNTRIFRANAFLDIRRLYLQFMSSSIQRELNYLADAPLPMFILPRLLKSMFRICCQL